MYIYSSEAQINRPWIYHLRRAADLKNRPCKHPILGQVTDFEGVQWDVRDTRTTKHGFDLHFGSLATDLAATGLPSLILTPQLRDFWETNRLRGHGFLFDLPAGRTTLKRARRRLGFNFDNDRHHFWTDRLQDLAELSPREFSAKHGVTPTNASDRHTRMIGPRGRPQGWWRTPETINLLLSGLTLRETGQKLGIGISQVFRLRRQAQQAMQKSASQKELPPHGL